MMQNGWSYRKEIKRSQLKSNMRRLKIFRIFVFLLLISTYCYQYLRLNKNISYIMELKTEISLISDRNTYDNYIVRDLNRILDGNLKNRYVLYCQIILIILFVFTMNKKDHGNP